MRKWPELLFSGALILSLLAASCSKYDSEAHISDVQKKEVLLLKKPQNKGDVVALNVRGSGVIKGEARISLMVDGKSYKSERLNNEVDFTWGGDWYADEAELIYDPATVTSGELLIQYRFETL
jgi:hypothetical protein